VEGPLGITRWGAQLPNLCRPEPQERPTAFIVVCADTAIAPNPAGFAVDVGIAAANITHTATEKGFGCCMLGNFKPVEVSALFSLDEKIAPQLVIAIGKPSEEIILDQFEERCPSTAYYRDENGAHHVPKRPLGEVLCKTRENSGKRVKPAL
jgi:nitroreductase